MVLRPTAVARVRRTTTSRSRSRERRLRLLLTAAALAACTPQPRAASPFVAERCPLPPTVTPYTVAATAPGHPGLDSAFLRSVLHAVVWHWQPGEPGAGLSAQDPRETAWLLGYRDTVVFEFHGARPQAGDRAMLGLTLRHGATVDARLLRASGRAPFDSSLLAAVWRATLARDTRRVTPDTLPAGLPAGVAEESLTVVLEFGADPATRALAVRFARESTPVTSLANFPPDYPRELFALRLDGDVLVDFAVDTSGQADMASVTVREVTHPRFAHEVLRVLPRYRFRPATLDCTPRRQWVQLPFRFSIGPEAFSGEYQRP